MEPLEWAILKLAGDELDARKGFIPSRTELAKMASGDTVSVERADLAVRSLERQGYFEFMDHGSDMLKLTATGFARYMGEYHRGLRERVKRELDATPKPWVVREVVAKISAKLGVGAFYVNHEANRLHPHHFRFVPPV